MHFHMRVLCNLIIQKYFFDTCLLIVTDRDNVFEYYGNISTVTLQPDRDDFNRSNPFRGYYGCKNIIIKSNKPVSAFRLIEQEIRLSLERFHTRKYLFVPGNDMTEELSEILSTYEITYVADLVVVEREVLIPGIPGFLSNHSEIYQLWTHCYIGTENRPNEKMLLDFWYSKNKSFAFNTNLYLDKFTNQMGRILKLGTMHYEPYNIVDGFTPEEYKGTESSAMKIFAKEVNATYKFVINNQDYWGDIFENWTGNGLLGMVADDTVDIAFAAMGHWGKLHPYVDFSVTFVRSGVTCIVPAPL
ncbi:Ionotropic receptor 41a.2, partial [Diabrotica virgifera virgifera]